MRFAPLLAFVTIAAACSGSGTPAADVPATGDAWADALSGEVPASDVVPKDPGRDFAGMEFAVCVPGTDKKMCTDDALSRVVCAEDGTGWVAEACGEDSLCLDGEIGCTACRPGNKKCQDDDVVLRCTETGSGYEVVENCDGSVTGRICMFGTCQKLCEINAKLQSYIGCEYWGADLDNAYLDSGAYDASGAQYAIVVSNTSAKYAANVQIFNADGEVTTDAKGAPLPLDPIPPMGLRIFNLPRRDVDGTVKKPLAYRVVSTIPITAYQFNPLENVEVFSNDATILLPSHVLGKYHIVMTREQTFQELKGFLTVLAVNPGETQVTVTVSAPTLPGDGIPRMSPGDTKVFILDQYDALNLETDAYGADLTGSIVYSNHPVAVFGGSEASNAPNTTHCCPDGECAYNQVWLECEDRDDCLCEWPHANLTPAQDVPCRNNYDCIKYNTCCADHLEMQMYPVKTWGREYVATRTYPRNQEKDVWRILAAKDQTKITTYPSQIDTPVLDRTEYVDFESDEHFEVHASGPILVGQFVSAQDAPGPNLGAPQPGDAGTGDPTFLLAVPVEQFRTEYVFLAPNKYKFDAVSLIVPAGMPVWLDGEELRQEDLEFRPAREILTELKEKDLEHPADLGIKFGDYNLIGTGAWAVWRVVVADGVHTAEAKEPFGVISYGYDRYVSYGYPAGLNLEDLKLVDDSMP